MGRLLIPLMLARAGRLPQPVLYRSAYLERHRERYMDLMLDVSRGGAWMEWVAFFLEGVAESATDSLRQAAGLLTLRQRYHDRLRKARSFGHLQRLVDRLFAVPSVTIGLAAKYLGVTTAAASGRRSQARPDLHRARDPGLNARPSGASAMTSGLVCAS